MDSITGMIATKRFGIVMAKTLILKTKQKIDVDNIHLDDNIYL
jgi:hypothetical protein